MGITVSVAIPCYKSAKTIRPVVEEVKQAILSRPENDYQIILVNDYPYDDTFGVIKEMCREDPKIIGVNLSKNFGQMYAKIAALPYFTGDVLVYMDDDGQHPAEQIYGLVDKIEEGYDVVYAEFTHKKHSLFKRVTSRIHRQLMIWSGTMPKGIVMSSFYGLSAFVVNELKKYKSPYPGDSGYMMCVTHKYANVKMEHRERMEGTSNYSLIKLIRLWVLGFFNYSMLPLRISAYTGFICAVCGFIFGLVLLLQKVFFGGDILPGYTSTVALLLFIGGLIMMMLGIIGEYLGRIYMTISDRPQYAVRETVNTEETCITEKVMV